MVSARSRGAASTLGYLAAYALAMVVGRAALLPDSQLAAFWPAAGVAVLWLLRGSSGTQLLLDTGLLFLTTVGVSLAQEVPLSAAVAFGGANITQGLVVRWGIARAHRQAVFGPIPRRLASTRDLLVLSAASLLAAVASSPFGLLASWLSNGEWHAFIELTWVVRNGCGTLVIAAAAMAVMTTWQRDHEEGAAGAPGRARLPLTIEARAGAFAELLGLLAATSMLGLSVFNAGTPIAFMLIVTSVWAGVRFAPVVGTLHTLGIGVLAVVSTQQGAGPFATIAEPALQVVVVQLFVALSLLIALILSLGAADRRRLLAQLITSEAQATARAEILNTVTSTMSEGLALVDASRRVVLSNPAAGFLGGVGESPVSTPEERGFRLLDGAPLPQSAGPIARALSGETVPPHDLLRVDPETGDQRIIEVSAAPLHLPGDGETLAVLVFRDVTDDRTQKRELETFAGVVAHDLKTPLTGVKSWSELLEDQLGDLPADTSEVLASLVHIEDSANRMQRLIDDLLAYTLSQSAEIDPTSVDLDSLVSDLTRSLRATNPGTRLRIEHDDLGWVRADRTLVRQLLANLISNAVKYVAPGVDPHIQVTTHPLGDMVEIRVADNGIGIPVSDRRRVFDSFYRSDGHAHYPGTGLGLAICTRAVERHGGRIAVRDGPDGVGTTIAFTLPAEPFPEGTEPRFAHDLAGYAATMSASTPAHGSGDPKPRPANPAAQGADAPTPPGGPQRSDASETDMVPDGRDWDAERLVYEEGGSSGGSTIPIEDEGPDPDQITIPKSEEELQEENAATSLDEPSDDLR